MPSETISCKESAIIMDGKANFALLRELRIEAEDVFIGGNDLARHF